jgi:hypothetical protein
VLAPTLAPLLPVLWMTTPVLLPALGALPVVKPVLEPVLALSASSALSLPLVLAFASALPLPLAFASALLLAFPFALTLALALAFVSALPLAFSLAFTLVLSLVFALELELLLALALPLALPLALALGLELELPLALAFPLAVPLEAAAFGAGSAAFGAGSATFGAGLLLLLDAGLALLPSPSPLPPIWFSLEWLGLSCFCATADALVWSWDLPCPFELSAASAGDVRASIRRTPAMTMDAWTTTRRTSACRLAKNSPNVSNCPPPRGYERLPRRHPGHGPLFHGDMSQNAPLSVP